MNQELFDITYNALCEREFNLQMCISSALCEDGDHVLNLNHELSLVRNNLNAVISLGVTS